MSKQVTANDRTSIPLVAVGLALMLCIIFASGMVAAKVGLRQFPPLFFGALVFTLASGALGVYARILGEELQPPSLTIWRSHCISALLFLLAKVALLGGLQWTLSIRASVFMAIYPFFVAIFNSLIARQERLKGSKLVGLSLTFAGVVIAFSDRLALGSGASWLGDSLVILSSVFLALIVLHLRRVTRSVSSIQAIFWQMVLSLPMFWLGAFIFESPLTFPQFSISWLAIAYNALVTNSIGLALRAELFRRYSANTISSFLAIVPIIGLGLGHLLLTEPLTWTVAIGGAIVSFGVFVVYRSKN
ncbi:MAG: DMT family transporter [Oscillatoria sp. SIO1A7]|nr:DMT family transporter [Oscillatoria sp. SIO1A7]